MTSIILKALGYTLRTAAALTLIAFIGAIIFLGLQAESAQTLGAVCFLAMFGGVATMAIASALNGIGTDLIDGL